MILILALSVLVCALLVYGLYAFKRKSMQLNSIVISRLLKGMRCKYISIQMLIWDDNWETFPMLNILFKVISEITKKHSCSYNSLCLSVRRSERLNILTFSSETELMRLFSYVLPAPPVLSLPSGSLSDFTFLYL